MPHDPAKVAETRAWLAKARLDLRAAEHDRTASPPITADIVFHAQQMVEKTLKAFLTWHDEPFRKTHSLIELGEQCSDLAPDLGPLLRRAAPLTEYAWRFRYPGETDDPSTREADEALAIAREVLEAIISHLPAEAVHP
jgi:HEPN domain-containing protein